MNSYIAPMFDMIAATPLEQFQILPLSAQVYPSAVGMTSLEEANLFPQLAENQDFVYMASGAASSVSTPELTS